MIFMEATASVSWFFSKVSFQAPAQTPVAVEMDSR